MYLFIYFFPNVGIFSCSAIEMGGWMDGTLYGLVGFHSRSNCEANSRGVKELIKHFFSFSRCFLSSTEFQFPAKSTH